MSWFSTWSLNGELIMAVMSCGKNNGIQWKKSRFGSSVRDIWTFRVSSVLNSAFQLHVLWACVWLVRLLLHCLSWTPQRAFRQAFGAIPFPSTTKHIFQMLLTQGWNKKSLGGIKSIEVDGGKKRDNSLEDQCFSYWGSGVVKILEIIKWVFEI